MNRKKAGEGSSIIGVSHGHIRPR